MGLGALLSVASSLLPEAVRDFSAKNPNTFVEVHEGPHHDPTSPAAILRNAADLDRFQVLYPPKDSAIRPLVARVLIAQGVPLFHNKIETASPDLGRAVTVSDLDTVWIISKGVVADDIASGPLVRLDIDMASALGAGGIISRGEEVPSVAARIFAKLLNDLCG